SARAKLRPACRCARPALCAVEPHRGIQSRRRQIGVHRGLPVGSGGAMSLTGGAAPGADAASWPRWARANVSAAMTVLAASPRFGAVQGTRARVLAAGLATILLVAVAMAFADAPIAAASKQLPGWVHAAFAFMTDFGKSGWFLWPTGIALAAIAAVS